MTVIDVALGVIGLAFLGGLVRIIIGPTLADRTVAGDLCLISVVAALALLSVRLEVPAFLDALLVASLVGFVATLSLARLVGRRKR